MTTPIFTVHPITGKLYRAIARMESQLNPIAIDYLRRVASRVVFHVNASDHEDTRRFNRSFAQAARQVGAMAVMKPLKPSRYAEFIAIKVRKDSKKWWKRSVEANRRLREANKRLDAASKRGAPNGIAKARAGVDRAKERAVKLSRRYAISHDKAKTVDRAIAQKQAMTAIGLRGKREMQIINRHYGGRGRLYVAGGSVFVSLQSMEPHARIVDSNYGVLRHAVAATKAELSTSNITAAALQKIASAWHRAA